ncbi:MAG: hypothetical protein RJB62_1124 [Pseudomonadota bacterium]|jgi:glutathione S-transferase
MILYDLAGQDGRRFSPNCWRTRWALAHKGVAVETRAVCFTQIASLADGAQKTVPVIDDGGHIIGDSWAIARYLETHYPDRPSLFGGKEAEGLTAFVQSWAITTLHAGIIPLILLDILNVLDSADRDYFRASREKRFGQTLEELQAPRDEHLPDFRNSLQPLRMMLKQQRWIGGDAPLYADYVCLAPFLWARVVSDFPLLEKDDPVMEWFERGLDLYDGLARKAPC